MACPYFQPVTRLDLGGWDPAPRLPLGGAWSGFCLASSSGSFAPAEEIQRELCNCGYARGRCAYFPAESREDAVRFALSAPNEHELMYIFEKDHAPVAFGTFRESEHRPAIVAQAKAFQGALQPLADAGPR